MNETEGGFYGYRASKAALNMFNRSLAVDLEEQGFTCVVMSLFRTRNDPETADSGNCLVMKDSQSESR